jgi:hypothetical protein
LIRKEFAVDFSQPTLHPGLIATPEEQDLVRGRFQAIAARRPKLAEQRLETGRRIPIALTTVTAGGNFDSYITVQFLNPSGEPTTETLLVDSGNTVMVIPHATPVLNSRYTFLGATTEPWGCPAYAMRGPLQIPTADGGLHEIPDCVFYACYQPNQQGQRTANFGTGRVIPWSASPASDPSGVDVTIQSPLSYDRSFQFAEFIYEPATSMFSPTGELRVSDASRLILNSYMPSGYRRLKIIPNLEWMSVVPVALSIGGTRTGWPGDVASPIAMVDTGGGPVFLSDPNGYVYPKTWPDTVVCPSWTQDPQLPSQNCNCVSDSLQITLAGADGVGTYTYTVDTASLPQPVRGLTGVMCQVNGFMMGQQGMNIGGVSALFNRILIEYNGDHVGLLVSP